MLGDLAESRIEPGLFAIRLVDAGLEVVDEPAPGDAAEVLEGAVVRHDPGGLDSRNCSKSMPGEN